MRGIEDGSRELLCNYIPGRVIRAFLYYELGYIIMRYAQ
jgi:hypothetical protein